MKAKYKRMYPWVPLQLVRTHHLLIRVPLHSQQLLILYMHATKESPSAVSGLALADKSASTTSPDYTVNTDYEIDSDRYNFDFSDYPTASPSSSVSSARVHTPPSSFYGSSPVASSTYPMVFPPFHPPSSYMLSHSQSWLPNNQVSLFFMLYDRICNYHNKRKFLLGENLCLFYSHSDCNFLSMHRADGDLYRMGRNDS